MITLIILIFLVWYDWWLDKKSRVRVNKAAQTQIKATNEALEYLRITND